MDLSKLAPAAGTGLAPRVVNRATRNAEPNPFLDNGWLLKSYEEKKDYVVTVPGAWEMGEVKKGERKGDPIERLTGDAAEVTRLLRDGADKLGIGVAIQYTIPTKKVKGVDVDVPGMVNVHYMGKQRKQARKTKTLEPGTA